MWEMSPPCVTGALNALEVSGSPWGCVCVCVTVPSVMFALAFYSEGCSTTTHPKPSLLMTFVLFKEVTSLFLIP